MLPESQIKASTKEVVTDIKDVVLEPDEILISYDVVSLYTNVPVEQAINETADLLYDGRWDDPPIDKNTFIELTRLCSTNVLMATTDGYYRQKEGLGMGLPSAPGLANVWMSKYDTIITQDKPKLYKRYVDDILTTILRNKIDEKLKQINELHDNLTFTYETEDSSGKLSFLDALLQHKEHKVSSTWYTKPTDNGLILNFHSLAPSKYKRNIVQGFVHRVYNACSDW